MLEAVYLFDKLFIIFLLRAKLRAPEVNKRYSACSWSRRDPVGEQHRQVRRSIQFSKP